MRSKKTGRVSKTVGVSITPDLLNLITARVKDLNGEVSSVSHYFQRLAKADMLIGPPLTKPKKALAAIAAEPPNDDNSLEELIRNSSHFSLPNEEWLADYMAKNRCSRESAIRAGVKQGIPSSDIAKAVDILQADAARKVLGRQRSKK